MADTHRIHVGVAVRIVQVVQLLVLDLHVHLQSSAKQCVSA